VVDDEETPILSGPGEGYYATDVLARGTRVEVYRHDAGGWLGIRPPEGSFCWVSADHLQPAADSDVALVGAEGAFAWIGARVGRVAQHKWQVKLQPGEKVQIIGDKRYLASMREQGQAWYKIAAPAGEFRWIHQRNTRRLDPPESDAAGDSHDDAEPPPSAASRIQLTGLDEPAATANARQRKVTKLEVRPIDKGESIEGQAARGGEAPAADDQRKDDGFVARKSHDDEMSQATAANRPATADQTAGEGESGASAALAGELRRIELELSATVAQEQSFWNIAPLRDQTEKLVERGTSALDRGRARLLLDKIAQFESLQQGKPIASETAPRSETVPGSSLAPAAGDALLYVPPATIAASAGTAPESRTGLKPVPPGASAPASGARFQQLAKEHRYDGVGWLLPVHSQLQIAPRFALTDDQGRVIQYVVPAPGRNLHRHLRKQVGVVGQQQSVSGLGAPVLTATNVIELERHR
jgi:hypothetical protein